MLKKTCHKNKELFLIMNENRKNQDNENYLYF